MKWTDVNPTSLNNDNPWDHNPWDKQKKQNRPGNQPQNSEDLDELIRKSQQVLQGFFNQKGTGGGKGSGKGGGMFGGPSPMKLIGMVLGGIFIIWALSGFYIIEEGSRGLVLRFGEYQRTTNPGPNYHLPFPIEKVEKVGVERIRTEEIGYSSFGRGGKERGILEESLMLTGDENIVDVRMDVQWVIKDARDYIFNVRDAGGENTVKSAAESAIRDVMGKTAYNTAIAGEGRAQIAKETQNLLQSILDNYHAGVQINSIQMRPIDPPAQVIDAFRDVQSARADKEKEINQAEAYRNDILPRAKGDAEKILQQAEAYKQEVIARAEGESDRFVAIYEKYKTAQTVTKQRMYLEAMEEILNGMEKVVIDSNAQGSGVLPYLPLSSLQNKNAR